MTARPRRLCGAAAGVIACAVVLTGAVMGPGVGAAVPRAPRARGLPSSVLNLENWKLTLPVSAGGGKPEEILQPKLAQFARPPFFVVARAGKGVVFRAPVGGATTENSDYPRTELREMNGSSEASWSNTSGTHTLTIREAITHLPAVKPHVVAGQIHDADDDVVMIRLEQSNLFVEQNGDSIGTLDGNYRLGTEFTVELVAADGHIKVFFNGVLKVDEARSGSGWYFKAGCYTQSNPSKGDAPKAYGQVVISQLEVTHT